MTGVMMSTTFNPPPASEMVDTPSGLPDPYHLKRIVQQSNRVLARGYKKFGPNTATRESYTRYQILCSRKRCYEEIEVRRVVTGESAHEAHGHVTTRQDTVYYWPDNVLVVETGNSFLRRPIQVGFCSYHCLSLWASAINRQKD
jgi:hypothetical protein